MPAAPHIRESEPTEIPCPHWCSREHGHPYATHDDGYRRLHRTELADLTPWGLTLTAEQVEHAASPSGPIDRQPADLGAAWLAPREVTFSGTACTPAGLRALADALSSAADFLATVARG